MNENKNIEKKEIEADTKSVGVQLRVSPLAKQIYKVLQVYGGTAETGNIQWELGLSGRQIANAVRNLIRLKLIKRIGIGCSIDAEYGGSTYKIIKAG